MLDFQRFFESIPELYLICSLDFVIVGGSDAYFRAVQIQRQEAVGRHLSEVFPNDDPHAMTAQSLQASLEQVLKHRQPHRMAVQPHHIHDSGSEDSKQTFKQRYYRPTNSPYFDENGEIAYIIHRLEDVTERIEPQRESQRDIANIPWNHSQSSSALCESEVRYRTLLELSTQMVWMLNAAGELVFLNQNFLDFFGQPFDKLQRENWAKNIHHPDDHQRVVDEIARAIATGTNIRSEHRLRRYDNQYRWCLHEAAPLQNARGEITHWLGVSFDIDDIKQAQNALRESEELKQRILESSHDCIKVLTLDGRFLYVNAGGVNLFEVDDPAILLNAEWISFWQGEEREKAKAAIAAATAGNIGQFQGFCLTAKGTAKWWDVIVTPIRDAAGRITQLLSISRDITQQKQAEEVLRESEERFRSMADNAPVMIWVTDSIGRCTYLSHNWYHFTGQTEATGLEFGWLNALHPADRNCVKTTFLEASQEHRAFRLEYRLRFRDGQYRWAIDAASPWFSSNGEFRGYIGSVIDITERKQTEAALRQSEERYRYLAELIPQLVWTASAEGVLLDVNQRWSNFTGLSLDQAQPTGWRGVVHPEDISGMSQQWTIAQQQGTRYQAQGRMRRADGVYRWHLHQAVPMKNEQGQILKWFGTATDIEDQKQLEQQRDRILQREQSARAASEAARKEAEQANRIKDEFLAVLSHELRSPLNPILGWSQLLQNNKLDQAQTQQALAVIARNAKLQSELIEDLLDVSRILQGKLTLNRCSVDLVTTIQSAMETVRLAAEAKSIQIHLLLDPEVGKVLGDPARLQQVVWNLLSNAVKFTAEGGKVEIRLEQQDAQALIIISDTGKGIQPDFLPHVFDYFRQADAATTRKFGGLGLGLAIVRHLVELHGGTVQVASPGEGLGATFTVKLPMLSLRPIPSSSRPFPEAEYSLQGIRVLVVDDDPDSRDFIAFLLEENGAEAIAAATANEAFNLLTHSRPDLLLSDIGMPEIDGYMLIQQIRSLSADQGGKIPAIALTAYAGEFNQQQALAAGFQQHIAKPVDPTLLIEAIAHCCSPQRYFQ